MNNQLMEQGRECLKLKQQEQALLHFNRVVLAEPNHLEALTSCANVLLNLNRPAEAAVYSLHALQIKPDCHFLTLHAKALYNMGKYLEALECFERVIAAQPNNHIAIGQRALCLTQVNRHEEALQTYQQALMINNQDSWLHYNYSLCLLTMGHLLDGFTHYEHRWSSVEKRREWIVPESAKLETMYGKSILIYFEQGLGDSIQFFRYIPLLVQLGARVFLELQPSLIPLFSAWRHSITFIGAGSPLPPCDYHCSMMSLPKLFKTELNNIPASIPYIFPETQALDICHKKLGYSIQKRIGIAWRGSALNLMDHKRSIALKTLLAIHKPNVNFICLQQDVKLHEKKLLDQHQIAYHSEELNTMSGTAALIACLDIVITVDTSIAHLAAAMGKPVWILLAFSADWRWFLQRDNSPWYPNVKLLRQETLNDWSSPLSRIDQWLQTL